MQVWLYQEVTWMIGSAECRTLRFSKCSPTAKDQKVLGSLALMILNITSKQLSLSQLVSNIQQTDQQVEFVRTLDLLRVKLINLDPVKQFRRTSQRIKEGNKISKT